jgi:H+/gluconate symporter-like permease
MYIIFVQIIKADRGSKMVIASVVCFIGTLIVGVFLFYKNKKSQKLSKENIKLLSAIQQIIEKNDNVNLLSDFGYEHYIVFTVTVELLCNNNSTITLECSEKTILICRDHIHEKFIYSPSQLEDILCKI